MYPQIIHFNRLFHEKKHPFWCILIFGNTRHFKGHIKAWCIGLTRCRWIILRVWDVSQDPTNSEIVSGETSNSFDF